MREISFVLTSFLTDTLFHFLNISPYILTSSFSTSSVPLLLSDSPSSSILQPPHASLFQSAALAFINSCLVFFPLILTTKVNELSRQCSATNSPFIPSLLTSAAARARAYCVKERNGCQSAGANTSCGCAAIASALLLHVRSAPYSTAVNQTLRSTTAQRGAEPPALTSTLWFFKYA